MEEASEQAAGGPMGQGLVEAISASQLEESKDELDFVAVRDDNNTSNILSRGRSIDPHPESRKQSGRF